MIVLHLKAKHDSNGNPRRLFLPLNDGLIETVQAVIIEGYAGRNNLNKLYPSNKHYVFIEVPVSEYNSWIAYGKEMEILYE